MRWGAELLSDFCFIIPDRATKRAGITGDALKSLMRLDFFVWAYKSSEKSELHDKPSVDVTFFG